MGGQYLRTRVVVSYSYMLAVSSLLQGYQGQKLEQTSALKHVMYR